MTPKDNQPNKQLLALQAMWSGSSIIAKAAIVIIPLILIAIVVISSIGLSNYFHNRSYEKREAKAVEEREAWMTERQQLQLEKAQLKGRLAEQEAVNETLKKVAVSKRADTDKTVKEIEAIEQEHEKRKQELEANGNTISDDALRRELCERLRTRGYKLTCSN